MDHRRKRGKFSRASAIFLSVACAAVLCFSFSGCKKEEAPVEAETKPDPSFPVELSVDGDSYTIRKKPQKIVSLTPDLTEAMNDIGAVSLIAGISDHCQEITGVSGKACGTAQAIDMQAVSAIKPNVVISSSPITDSQMEQLAQIDAQVIQFSRPITVDEICNRYRNLYLLCYGTTSGGEQGEAFAKKYQEKLSAIFDPASEYASLSKEKTAAYLADLDFTMATGDTFEGDLMEQMGLLNAAQSYTHWSYPETAEKELNPDVIFYDSSLDPKEIAESEVYQDTAAVKGNQLFEVDFGAVQRGNLAMIDQLSEMARSCYPEAFSGSYHPASDSDGEQPDAPQALEESQDAPPTEPDEEPAPAFSEDGGSGSADEPEEEILEEDVEEISLE